MSLTGGDTMAVVGQGLVGLSATQLAAAMGARVIALDSQRRAAQARHGVRGRRLTIERGRRGAVIDADPRHRRRPTPGDLRHGGRRPDRGTRCSTVGRRLLGRRRRRRDDRCHPPTLASRSRGSPRGRSPRPSRPTARASSPSTRSTSSSVHRSLAADGGRDRLRIARPADHRQGRILDVGRTRFSAATENPRPCRRTRPAAPTPWRGRRRG